MMKTSAIILLTILMLACSTSKKTVETVAVETEKVENKIGTIKNEYPQKTRKITAKKDTNGYLSGVANKDSFQDDSFKVWFNSRYSEYTVDKEIVDKLKIALKGYTIKGFMGTWCGDSKRETPRFYKILDETGFDQNNFNRDKKTPDNLQEGLNIIRVPTFIFYKGDKEVGRYVEYPRETIEKDILKIVTGQPYKHSYDKTK